MKKDSSKQKRNMSPPRSGRYPRRDNVYNLQQERQRRQVRQGQGVRKRRREELQYQQAPPRVVKATPKRSKNSYLIMPVLVFMLIALYLVGQIFLMVSKRSDINMEAVAYGSIDTPEIYTGLILRDEYVVTSNRTGQPFYQYSEGDYISKGAVVCTVKDVDSTEPLEKKLDEIDQDILESQKARTDLSTFSEDISRLEGRMANTVDAYAGNAMKQDLSYMYTMKSQIISSMNQRNEIWLTENVESLSELTEEKGIYEQQLSESMSSLAAEESGILCLSYDGLEETYAPDMAAEITEKEIGAAKTEYISKAKSVQDGDPLFKVIRSNQWSVVCYLPASVTAGWEVGDGMHLNTITEDDTLGIYMTIESIDRAEESKETKVVFSGYEHMSQFMDERTISFSLEGEIPVGLKIPNDAIVEKSLLRIPIACLTESLGNEGVLLLDGEESRFVDISIMMQDADSVYIEQEASGLKLGDIILQGTGEGAAQYTLAELAPCPGVYVTNSSMANFVAVEIIDQNQEYAIVKAGTLTGLQPYDYIISDAKNIKEGQSLY